MAGVLLEDTNNHHLMLEAAEWATIEGLVQLLQPFQQVAEMLSASKYPTISMVKPLLHMLLNTTLNPKETDPKEISMAKEVIAKELAKTYQESPEIDLFLNVATFLDPRYKRLPFLSTFERQQVENRVLEEAKGLLEKVKEGAYRASEDKALFSPSSESFFSLTVFFSLRLPEEKKKRKKEKGKSSPPSLMLLLLFLFFFPARRKKKKPNSPLPVQ